MIQHVTKQNKLILELQSNSKDSGGAKFNDGDAARLVQQLSDKIQPLQESLYKEKQTNTQLAKQVIKFNEEMDKLDKQLLEKEKQYD